MPSHSLILPNPPACQRLVIALSGGVDSMVLLHWLSVWQRLHRPSLPLLAIHVNHGLSANAEAWQNFVGDFCTRENIPLEVEYVTVLNAGEGIEQAARKARYSAFEKHLKLGDLLVMGHHANDQAETFLLRLMRGAGVQGLSAMPPLRKLNHGLLWRPFLSTPKQDLLAYARTHQLQWVEDESNQQQKYSRNFLRTSVSPLLAQHWPDATVKINHAAVHLQEAQNLLDEYAAQDLMAADPRREKLGCSLCLIALAAFSWSRQKQLIRYWLKSLGYLAPEAIHFDELCKIIFAKNDAKPMLQIGYYTFSRFKQRLYILPKLTIITTTEPVIFSDEVFLPDGSVCRVEGLAQAHTITVKWRQGGERAHPEGRGHSQTLKKLLQEYQVPPWLRERVPLLFINDTLIAVADYWLEQGAKAMFGANLTVSWRFDSTI
ncbi:MAG: tRNA lysidine(34) synthetase TilS [Marinagarivorans sp.]|nr:tRNA lysidine(34) synthetase TilS [Marinagarivorans sp.]